jgi:HK97 gp10 family phage protein
MRITATTQGFDAARELIARIPIEMNRRVMRKAMTRAAVPVVYHAKRNAAASPSFETGLLRDSIGARVTAKKRKPGQLIGDVVANIRPLARAVIVERTNPDGTKYQRKSKASQYAHHLEFGNRHQAATPIFAPAMDSSRDEAFSRMVDTVGEELDRITETQARKAAREAKKKLTKT